MPVRAAAVTLLLAGVVVAVLVARPPVSGPHSMDEPGQRLELFIDDFTAIATDPSGRIERRLSAVRLERSAGDGSLFIEQPRARHYPAPGAAQWSVESGQATIGPQAERVKMEHSVRVQRDPHPGSDGLRISTDVLWAGPGKDFVETDRAVQLESAGSRMNAVGMRAWLDSGRIALLSDVRGHHVTESKTP